MDGVFSQPDPSRTPVPLDMTESQARSALRRLLKVDQSTAPSQAAVQTQGSDRPRDSAIARKAGHVCVRTCVYVRACVRKYE